MSTHAASTLATDAPPKETTVDLAAAFVVRQLEKHRKGLKEGEKGRPLVVGVQGPQGSGKSYLASLLPSALSSPSHGSLRTATLSLDDLYLPHSGLASVAQQYAGNALLKGRGQAGTHDLPLGLSVLRALKSGGSEAVEIPVFEKSLHGGEGDRLEKSKWVKVENPSAVDVVVLEGWMLGFRPVSAHSSSSLAELYSAAKAAPDSEETKQKLGIDYAPPFLLEHKLEDLQQVEELLKGYEELWSEVDVAVQIKPEKMGYVWEWRLEQEHNMKAKNGGIGMTDEQVKNFIARYMPGYELWLPGLSAPASTSSSWTGGNGLRVVIGKKREVSRAEDL
ncbi:hypothetical protein JCM8547_007619 [Rhodosporidiobolus lusitaniae]